MRRAIFVALGTGSIISGAAALGIDAHGGMPTQPLTQREYRAALESIVARAAQASAACERAPAADREYCRVRAEAEQAWREAELQVALRRDRESARNAQRARIEARYHAERAQCAPLTGPRKDSCLIGVHARKGRAMLEAAGPYENRGWDAKTG